MKDTRQKGDVYAWIAVIFATEHSYGSSSLVFRAIHFQFNIGAFATLASPSSSLLSSSVRHPPFRIDIDVT